MSNKVLLFLVISPFILSSCSNNEEEQPLSGYEGALTIHARCIDGKYDGEFNPLTYSVHIGDDISGLKIPDKKGVFDGHPVLAKAIYTSKKEKTKVKASQLKNFDGTFSDLYVLYYYLNGKVKENQYINPSEDFDGNYTNLKGDIIQIDQGIISGKYGELDFVSTAIKREDPYYCDDAVLSDGSKELKTSEINLASHAIKFYSTGNILNNEGTAVDYFDLTKRCVYLPFLCDLVSEYYDESKNPIEFHYIGNNDLSIDYDL